MMRLVDISPYYGKFLEIIKISYGNYPGLARRSIETS